MPKISIIMPLYNAEKYLEESLNAVLGQTFSEYELICVNDASTDATLNILSDYAARDERIRIVSNGKRSGAAFSRNRGLKEAGGKYLSFLDGDDIFEEEMLECAYKTAEEHHADVVVFQRKHCTNEEIHNKQRVVHGKIFVERFCIQPFKVSDQMPNEFMNWELAPANKLYHREFVCSNRLEFQDLSCENDAYFVFMTLALAGRVICLHDDRVMIYARDHFEPTRISCDRDPMCSYQAFLHIAGELQKREKFAEVYPQFYYQFFFSVRNALFKCRLETREREYYQFLKEEGIDKMRLIGKEYYDRLDDYIKDLIEGFEKKEFDTGWYREEQGLLIQLSQKYNADAVRRLFADCKKAGKPIGIWGAGINGLSLLHFCRDNELEADMVVDRSPEKQGREIDGYCVSSPEKIGDRVKVIIVTARYILESVRQEVEQQDVEIIDINEFLAIY